MTVKRQIEPKMVDYIDKKLAGNGLAQHAIDDKNARLLFQLAAEACVGIHEKTGRNDGPMVELIQETIGGAGHEAWCMSFVQTCIAYAELKCGVVSPIAAGEHCLTVWAQSPIKQRVQMIPAPGAIIIWKHGKSTNGHTGIVRHFDPPVMSAVEGNTTGGVTADGAIERDGGGVHLTKRDCKANGDMKVVGFLKPF